MNPLPEKSLLRKSMVGLVRPASSMGKFRVEACLARQHSREERTFAEYALHFDPPALALEYFPGKSQPQPRAPVRPGRARVQLLKFMKKPPQVLFPDSNAGVPDRHREPVTPTQIRLDLDLSAFAGKLDAVRNQVIKHLLELLFVES